MSSADDLGGLVRLGDRLGAVDRHDLDRLGAEVDGAPTIDDLDQVADRFRRFLEWRIHTMCVGLELEIAARRLSLGVIE